ncbi:hypothetical protein DFJ43DRAFT_573451 [Lentinula guzmanii]|uniref:Uncharacterized protein n=1 Tax=Lentinula guzmanii TaxID=2804957 RepID=A0AA38JFB7_9AGAR|nr:hypothetical protein DFJ43DRAFT_573451 [Lentinula guzmanii]
MYKMISNPSALLVAVLAMSAVTTFAAPIPFRSGTAVARDAPVFPRRSLYDYHTNVAREEAAKREPAPEPAKKPKKKRSNKKGKRSKRSLAQVLHLVLHPALVVPALVPETTLALAPPLVLPPGLVQVQVQARRLVPVHLLVPCREAVDLQALPRHLPTLALALQLQALLVPLILAPPLILGLPQQLARLTLVQPPPVLRELQRLAQPVPPILVHRPTLALQLVVRPTPLIPAHPPTLLLAPQQAVRRAPLTLPRVLLPQMQHPVQPHLAQALTLPQVLLPRMQHLAQPPMLPQALLPQMLRPLPLPLPLLPARHLQQLLNVVKSGADSLLEPLRSVRGGCNNS